MISGRQARASKWVNDMSRLAKSALLLFASAFFILAVWHMQGSPHFTSEGAFRSLERSFLVEDTDIVASYTKEDSSWKDHNTVSFDGEYLYCGYAFESGSVFGFCFPDGPLRVQKTGARAACIQGEVLLFDNWQDMPDGSRVNFSYSALFLFVMDKEQRAGRACIRVKVLYGGEEYVFESQAEGLGEGFFAFLGENHLISGQDSLPKELLNDMTYGRVPAEVNVTFDKGTNKEYSEACLINANDT